MSACLRARLGLDLQTHGILELPICRGYQARAARMASVDSAESEEFSCLTRLPPGKSTGMSALEKHQDQDTIWALARRSTGVWEKEFVEKINFLPNEANRSFGINKRMALPGQRKATLSFLQPLAGARAAKSVYWSWSPTLALELFAAFIEIKRFELESRPSKKNLGGITMRSKLIAGLTVAVGLLMVAGPLFAHHSEALYDKEHPVNLRGTVTDFKFINPHVQIHFQVKGENGNVVKWVAGMGAPQRMYRDGWDKQTLKPGDQISISGHPAKGGRKIMNVRKLVGPDGKVLREAAE